MIFLKNKNNYIYIIPIISFFIYSTLAFNTVISFDSSFSVYIAKLPLNELIKITASDVHPPLYYIILKYFIAIFSDNIYLLQFFSIIPILLLSIFGSKKIKSLFSIKEAIYFQLTILCTPFVISQSINIRMYSWAILFVTLSCIYAVSILNDNKKDYIYLTIFSILSAYTHTYALFFISFLYLNLIIYSIIKKSYKEITISSLVCLVSYTPWFIVLFRQVKTVSEGFWISYSSINNYLNIFIIISLCLLIISYIFNKNINFDTRIYYFTVIPFTETLIFILLYSKYIEPVFLPRYMTVGIGMLILYISLVISNLNKKRLTILSHVLLIIAFTVGYINVFRIQYNKTNKIENDYLINILNPKTTIITDISHYATIYSPLAYYKEYGTQYWLQNNKINYAESINGTIIPIKEIKTLDLNQDIYLIINDVEYLKIIDNFGLKYTLLNDFENFNVYKIINNN
ncbi:MAG: glycosyltransferase family 39 protein [Erysipelotrichaceae bacterium]|jgi:uncharacterized membrane protein